MSTSKVAVIESVEVRELSRFLNYLDILNYFCSCSGNIQNRSISELSMFYRKFDYMHACILHVLSARPTRLTRSYFKYFKS